MARQRKEDARTSELEAERAQEIEEEKARAALQCAEREKEREKERERREAVTLQKARRGQRERDTHTRALQEIVTRNKAARARADTAAARGAVVQNDLHIQNRFLSLSLSLSLPLS